MQLYADINIGEKVVISHLEERKRKFLVKFEKGDIFNKYLIARELIDQREEWESSGKEHEPVIYWLLEEHLSLKTYISKFYLTMREKYPFSELQKHKERYLRVLEPCVDISYIVKNLFTYTRAMFHTGDNTPMIFIEGMKKEEVYIRFLKDIKYLSGFKADYPEKSSVKIIHDYLIQFEDKELSDDEWKGIAWHAMNMAIKEGLANNIPTDGSSSELYFVNGRITVDLLPSSIERKWL